MAFFPLCVCVFKVGLPLRGGGGRGNYQIVAVGSVYKQLQKLAGSYSIFASLSKIIAYRRRSEG